MVWWKWVGRTLLTAPVVVVCSERIASVGVVHGRSMQPTLNPSDLVLVRKYGQFQQGDVVALTSPVDPADVLVKRVTGLAQSDVSLTRAARVPPRIPSVYRATYAEDGSSVHVPPSHCWVEGDNKDNSEDSYTFGVVSASLVQGVVVCVLWPPSRFLSRV